MAQLLFFFKQIYTQIRNNVGGSLLTFFFHTFVQKLFQDENGVLRFEKVRHRGLNRASTVNRFIFRICVIFIVSCCDLSLFLWCLFGPWYDRGTK